MYLRRDLITPRTQWLLNLLYVHDAKGSVVITPDDFRILVGAKGQYQQFTELRRLVIEPAINVLRQRGALIVCQYAMSPVVPVEGINVSALHFIFNLNYMNLSVGGDRSAPFVPEDVAAEFELQVAAHKPLQH